MSERAFETDIADLYRDGNQKDYVPGAERVYTTISVLQFLRGQLWDNLALNYVEDAPAIRGTGRVGRKTIGLRASRLEDVWDSD